MNITHPSRLSLGVIAVAALAVTGTSGQTPAEPPQDPVLAEIRALRADLNHRLEASIRAQLLVARLTLQEQRINSVLTQLRQVDDKVRENLGARTSSEAMVKMFGLDKPDLSAEQKEGANVFFETLKAGLDNLQDADAELKRQQADLSAQLAQEQARWRAFSSLLDELEATLLNPRR